MFSAAYTGDDLRDILEIADHVVFNSCAQWQRFRPLALAAQASRPGLKFGLRVNPEHSEGTVPIYDPCAPGSRLGIPLSQLDEAALEHISGLHFHTLCEQDFPPLARTLAAVEERFGHLLAQMKWVNFGGGHHITRPGYQIEELVACIRDFAARHQVQVYLEPGEAIAIGTGVLVAEVILLAFFSIPFWYRNVDAAPPPENEATVVRVIAEQFAWNVHYPGADRVFGRTDIRLVSPDNPLGLDRDEAVGRDDLVVNGTKIWTTHAHYANRMFCLVRTGKFDRPQRGVTFLLLDMKAPGVSTRPIPFFSGDFEQCQVFFDNVRVPRANVVGQENEGWSVTKYLLEFERGGGSSARISCGGRGGSLACLSTTPTGVDA